MESSALSGDSMPTVARSALEEELAQMRFRKVGGTSGASGRKLVCRICIIFHVSVSWHRRQAFVRGRCEAGGATPQKKRGARALQAARADERAYLEALHHARVLVMEWSEEDRGGAVSGRRVMIGKLREEQAMAVQRQLIHEATNARA